MAAVRFYKPEVVYLGRGLRYFIEIWFGNGFPTTQTGVTNGNSTGATGRLLEAKPPQCVTQASPDSEACNKNLTDSVDVSCHI